MTNGRFRNDSSLLWGAGASVFLHILMAALVLTSSPALLTPSELPSQVFTVDFLKPQEKQKAASLPRQIVSEPNLKPVAEAPDNARFLAERHYATMREQIKRGEGPGAGLPGAVQPAQPAPRPESPKPPAQQRSASLQKSAPAQPPEKKAPAAREERPAQLPPSKVSRAAAPPAPKTEKNPVREKAEAPEGITRAETQAPHRQEKLALKLDTDAAIAQFGAQSGKTAESRERTDPLRQTVPLDQYQAFSRPLGSGAQFLGVPGTSDHLPNLPDGDLTLLNAKAEQFAVFVRRVAMQVFTQLRVQGWDQLSAGDVRAIRDFATVRAQLSPDGTLEQVTLLGPSGASRFDSVLVAATRNGAYDRNPPKGALNSDGKIAFIFKARSWSRFSGDSRTGAMVERRWLLLSTGLE